MNPRVSVIIPAFNVESYIRECLESILAQEGCTYEIILIDDCSSDGTLALAQSILAGSPSAKVVGLTENIGQARARNIGLDTAEGEFIAFLDSDDFYSTKDALRTWCDKAAETGADLVRCNFHRVDENGRFLSAGSDLGLAEPVVLGDVDEYPYVVNITTCWQFLYKRSFLVDHNIRFSELLRQREDRLFFSEALLRAKRIGIIPDRLMRHRIHAKSTMRNVSLEQLQQFAIHIEEMNKLLSDNQLRHAPTFLAENLGFYFASVLGYWRPLIQLGSSAKGGSIPAEVIKLIDALGNADWTPGSLTSLHYLDMKPERAERFREYDVDFLRVLARHRKYRLFCDVVSGRRLGPDEILQAQLVDNPTDEEYACRYLSFSRLTAFRQKERRERAGEHRPRIVLHCGMPKTGTSSLQSHFEANRFRLLRDRGVYYPLTGYERGREYRRHRTAGHARLINNILNGDGELVGELDAELALINAPIDRVILSCENIMSHRFWTGEITIEKIANAFAGYEVIPVVYFRPQAEWLDSMYVELLSNPNNNIAHDPDEFVTWQKEFSFLDYEQVIDAFERVFKGGHFLPYKSAPSSDTVAQFYESVGIKPLDAALPGAPEMRNTSAPPEVALLVKELKQRAVSAKTRSKIVDEVGRTKHTAGNSRSGRRLIPTDILAQVRDEYRASNARVEASRLGAGALADDAVFQKRLATLDEFAVPARAAVIGFKTHPGRVKRKWARKLGWRGAFVPLVRPIVTRVSRESAIEKFDQNPSTYFRDTKNPILRRVGRVLFG